MLRGVVPGSVTISAEQIQFAFSDIVALLPFNLRRHADFRDVFLKFGLGSLNIDLYKFANAAELSGPESPNAPGLGGNRVLFPTQELPGDFLDLLFPAVDISIGFGNLMTGGFFFTCGEQLCRLLVRANAGWRDSE